MRCIREVRKVLRKLAEISRDGDVIIVDIDYGTGTLTIRNVDRNITIRMRVSRECAATVRNVLTLSPIIRG